MMKMIVLLLVCLLPVAKAEKFTAIVELKNSVYIENNMVQQLNSYIEAEEKKIEHLKLMATKLNRVSKEAVEDPEHYLGHPVNSFLLIKRFHYDWQEIETFIRMDEPRTDYIANISTYKDSIPSVEDVEGAALALLRLQDTYRLPTSAISNGTIKGTWDTEPLSASECFEIGRAAYNEDDHYHSVLWMQEAYKKMMNENKPDVQKITVLDYLAYSTYMQGNTEAAMGVTDLLLQLDNTHERALSNKEYFTNELKKLEKKQGENGKDPDGKDGLMDIPPGDRPLTSLDERERYEALCRGDSNAVKVQGKPWQLRCFYTHNNAPRLLLSPIKTEVVFKNPTLIYYHDILSEYEVEVIKSLALPKLNRATIQNPKTGVLEFANYRISKSAWLKGIEHKVVETVNNRIQDVTGLTMETAEELQVVNYGIGGHYEPHFDFARRPNAYSVGNRLATMLFYMSDVEAGGATVFTEVGARMLPIKYSAAFWYNLFKSGDGDMLTRHAGCPVLAGSKWVSNKWIHEYGQEFRRPCSLSQHE
ncbi:prolyl 4-hydroxylase subunit alpha-1-like isoform X2 [Anneissia japonica]|uniref:prolyl 4-hydroxylase subunit alpha-1-like isoform X2 n=1 Tax=Anneissia japonica TaxID=1529436 RepID=UPI001425B475|nr:prolyl 4-hydroxylase subunit alpha-1-like isoform X2 [Anneissia japonica]